MLKHSVYLKTFHVCSRFELVRFITVKIGNSMFLKRNSNKLTSKKLSQNFDVTSSSTSNITFFVILAVLVCNNTTVKLQVYELMCALCMFSPDGLIFVRELLSHIKVIITITIIAMH